MDIYIILTKVEIVCLPFVGHESFLQLTPTLSHGFSNQENIRDAHIGVLLDNIRFSMVLKMSEIPPMRGRALKCVSNLSE